MPLITTIKKYQQCYHNCFVTYRHCIDNIHSYCDTACRYLKGNIWGIDLKWVGIAYMLAIIIFAALRLSPFVKAMLAGGLIALNLRHDFLLNIQRWQGD